MPHATEPSSTTTMTNGTHSPTNSKFLSHLHSYPVVSDTVSTLKDHPYGKKSLEIADGVYNKYGKAVEPYLEKPYGYAKPYVAKADELADSGLSQVDSRFPIVKEETGNLVEKGKSVVWWPLSVAVQGKDYVIGTWNDEYNKTATHKSRGAGLTTSVLAIISTELKIASDFFQIVADFLGPKYEESKDKASAYAQDAKETAQQYRDVAADKVNQLAANGEQTIDEARGKAEEVKKTGESKAEEARKVGNEKVEQGRKVAGEKVEQGKKAAQK